VKSQLKIKDLVNIKYIAINASFTENALFNILIVLYVYRLIEVFENYMLI